MSREIAAPKFAKSSQGCQPKRRGSTDIESTSRAALEHIMGLFEAEKIQGAYLSGSASAWSGSGVIPCILDID